VEVPLVVDAEGCKTFQADTGTAIQELFIAVESFEKAGAEVKSADQNSRQALQQTTKEASKILKDIKKLNTTAFQCNPTHVSAVANALKQLEKNTLVQARHDLAILKKDEKVQPQFFGIRKDIKDAGAALARISKEKAKEMEAEIQYFEGCKEDFEELVLAEELVLDSEILEVSERCSTAKKQIEALAKEKVTKSTVLKKETKKKQTLKQSAKKKSLKKKSDKKGKKGKKSSKKKKKSKKSKKSKK
jgi:hypothetical protein